MANNKKTAISVVYIVLGMFFLAFASFPLYNLFCKATGYGGTPKVSLGQESKMLGNRVVKIEFNADLAPGLDWKFEPLQRSVEVRVGENKQVYYSSENLTNNEEVGMATFNVLPEKAAMYFNKVQCFCFNQQTLKPHEKIKMPVVFFVDPKFESDPEMADVKTITLSYTFFKANN